MIEWSYRLYNTRVPGKYILYNTPYIHGQFIGMFLSIFGDFLMTIFLTHWGRVTHICVSKLIIIGSDNSLSPGRRQAIIWTNAGILLIGPLGTNFSEILIEFYTFPFKKIHLKMSSGKNCDHFVSASMCWYRKNLIQTLSILWKDLYTANTT